MKKFWILFYPMKSYWNDLNQWNNITSHSFKHNQKPNYYKWYNCLSQGQKSKQIHQTRKEMRLV